MASSLSAFSRAVTPSTTRAKRYRGVYDPNATLRVYRLPRGPQWSRRRDGTWHDCAPGLDSTPATSRRPAVGCHIVGSLLGSGDDVPAPGARGPRAPAPSRLGRRGIHLPLPREQLAVTTPTSPSASCGTSFMATGRSSIRRARTGLHPPALDARHERGARGHARVLLHGAGRLFGFASSPRCARFGALRPSPAARSRSCRFSARRRSSTTRAQASSIPSASCCWRSSTSGSAGLATNRSIATL